MTHTCLIVDDEETARRGLAALLEDFPRLKVIGLCANGIEAIDHVRSLKPDLVFLDVQMPGISGFEVLASLPKPWPHVIFITAHDQFALKAFEVNAVDYLLKPFSDERFEEAISRVMKKLEATKSATNSLQHLVDHTNATLKGSSSLVEESESGERLVIKVDGSIHLLDLANISHIEAFDYYVKIHVQDRFFLLRETMKKMEERLSKANFLRIHKSFIVRVGCIKALHQLENHDYELELTNTTRLKVSRNYKAQMMEKLGI